MVHSRSIIQWSPPVWWSQEQDVPVLEQAPISLFLAEEGKSEEMRRHAIGRYEEGDLM